MVNKILKLCRSIFITLLSVAIPILTYASFINGWPIMLTVLLGIGLVIQAFTVFYIVWTDEL